MAENVSQDSIASTGHQLALSEQHVDNMSQILDESASSIPELSESLAQGNPETIAAVVLLCVTGCVALLASLLVFLATRCVSQDRNTTVVIVANMCMADVLAGSYGVARAADLYVRPPLVNCFLWDSLLFTSLVISSILLPCLIWDSFNAPKPSSVDRKRHLVISMVFLWDGAVIVGFVPLMGWNKWSEMDRNLQTCHFFQYYGTNYLVFVGSVILISLTCSFGLAIMMVVRRGGIHGNIPEQASYASPMQLEHCQRSIVTCFYITCCQLVCFLPFAIAILVAYQFTNLDSDTFLLYVITVAEIKSVLVPLILGKRTYQVELVFKQAKKLQLNSSFMCCALEEDGTGSRTVSQRSDRSIAQQTSISVISQEATTNNGQSRASAGTSQRVARHTTSYRCSATHRTLPRDKFAARRESCSPSHMCYKCGYTNEAFTRHSLLSLSTLERPSPTKKVTNGRLEMATTSERNNDVPALPSERSTVIVNPFCKLHGMMAARNGSN